MSRSRRALELEDKFTRRVWYRNPSGDDPERRGTSNDSLYHFEGLMDLGQVKDLLHLENDHVMYFFCSALCGNHPVVAAVMGSNSRRWRGTSTLSSRRSYRDDVASMAV